MLVPFLELIIHPPSFFFSYSLRDSFPVEVAIWCCFLPFAVLLFLLYSTCATPFPFFMFGDIGKCNFYNNQSLILQKKNNRLQRISILFNVWFLCWKNYNPSKYLAAQKDPTPLGNGVWELWFTNKLRPVFLFLINWL